MHGAFVTGTDTSVGKTVVASVLVAALRQSGDVGYWKPVQTGIEEDDDTAEVRRLARCADEEVADLGIRLPRPLSPHLSARLAGTRICVGDALAIYRRLANDRFWVVEGAGGLLVPLNDSETMADLIAAVGLPAVIASRSGLGTINHTLLTVRELRARELPIAGVVMVGEPNPPNREAIERYGEVEVLGEVPVLRPLGPGPVEQLAGGLAHSLARLRRAGPADRSGV